MQRRLGKIPQLIIRGDYSVLKDIDATYLTYITMVPIKYLFDRYVIGGICLFMKAIKEWIPPKAVCKLIALLLLDVNYWLKGI